MAFLLEGKKQEQPLHQRLRLATEGQQSSGGCQAAEADIVELSALNRSEVDQFKATLLLHNNYVELLELRYRTEAGSAELCHFESPGVQTVTAPLSPIQWAAGFRNCLNLEARDVFDAFSKELEQSPDSEGLGPTAETCHSARASSRDGAGSWSFRAVPEAQGSQNGPLPRSVPAGCPIRTVQR